jgi:hypothetical protein
MDTGEYVSKHLCFFFLFRLYLVWRKFFYGKCFPYFLVFNETENS